MCCLCKTSFSQFETHKTYHLHNNTFVDGERSSSNSSSFDRLNGQKRKSERQSRLHTPKTLWCAVNLCFIFFFISFKHTDRVIRNWRKERVCVRVCCVYMRRALLFDPALQHTESENALSPQKVFLHKLIGVYRIYVSSCLFWLFVIVYIICACVACVCMLFGLCCEWYIIVFVFRFLFVLFCCLLVTVWELSSAVRVKQRQISHVSVSPCECVCVCSEQEWKHI